MQTIAMGLLGTVKDLPAKHERKKWRPTLSLFCQPTLKIDQYYLLHDSSYKRLATRVKKDIAILAPDCIVELIEIDLHDPWDFEAVYAALQDFVTSLKVDTGQAHYYVHMTTGSFVSKICWFMLCESRQMPAKLLQSVPPSLQKEASNTENEPLPYAKIVITDLELGRYDRLKSRFARVQQTHVQQLKAGISTQNAAYNQLIEELEFIAVRSQAPLLITGSTGTGKSQLAKRIYALKQHSQHLKGSYVAVNCATLRGDAAMSALFGHVKGAFTGADQPRNGYLRQAHHGVLFLDEIGELGLDEQAMLLHALEEKTFYPFGGDQQVHSDFQLIAGTHRILQERVQAGLFREDLLARLNLWHYHLPNLAARREDIAPNLEWELEKFSELTGKVVRFNAEAQHAFLSFAMSNDAIWSGNFRELTASVNRMVTLCEEGLITLPIVEREIARLRQQWQMSFTQNPAHTVNVSLDENWSHLDLIEQAQLQAVLSICQRAKTLSEAGRLLFAQSRMQKKCPNDADRLRKYLAKYDLSWQQIKNP